MSFKMSIKQLTAKTMSACLLCSSFGFACETKTEEIKVLDGGGAFLMVMARLLSLSHSSRF